MPELCEIQEIIGVVDSSSNNNFSKIYVTYADGEQTVLKPRLEEEKRKSRGGVINYVDLIQSDYLLDILLSNYWK